MNEDITLNELLEVLARMKRENGDDGNVPVFVYAKHDEWGIDYVKFCRHNCGYEVAIWAS